MKTLLRTTIPVAALVLATSAQAQQGTPPETRPATPLAAAARPATQGQNPLANVSKAMPRRKGAMAAQRDSLVALSRASAARARAAEAAEAKK